MNNQEQLLCLNILGYKKPLVSGLMEKYGFTRWTMVCANFQRKSLYTRQEVEADALQTHNSETTRANMERIFDPQFSNIASYDSVIQIVFPDIECFVRMKADPYFKEKVGPDHENFADTKSSQ
jgi:hypothetical protein